MFGCFFVYIRVIGSEKILKTDLVLNNQRSLTECEKIFGGNEDEEKRKKSFIIYPDGGYGIYVIACCRKTDGG